MLLRFSCLLSGNYWKWSVPLSPSAPSSPLLLFILLESEGHSASRARSGWVCLHLPSKLSHHRLQKSPGRRVRMSDCSLVLVPQTLIPGHQLTTLLKGRISRSWTCCGAGSQSGCHVCDLERGSGLTEQSRCQNSTTYKHCENENFLVCKVGITVIPF